MSDYQDRGTGTGDTGGTVHQIVFRWDGNHGRQGTGMNAVAHSCSPERAEELGRELGPLLWVSGADAARRSVVRTLSRDGDVMLVQRWPTTDRGGRPSTVSHVLVGDPSVLKTRQCIGLSYGGWGSRESAEQASGPQRTVACSDLAALARKRLPGMLELLPTVEHALILVTAEWLRDPAQRVSLLAARERSPGWPDRDAAPLVYLGLFLLFGSWLDREWTFATYDTVDTHPLRLTCVPRWEPDTGGSGPLARVMDWAPASPRFEHRAAARLVDHLLTHPQEGPGVPQLVDEFRDGAALGWAQRRARLQEILAPDRPPGPHRGTPASRAADPSPHGHRDHGPARSSLTAPPPEPYPTPTPPAASPEPYPAPAPRTSQDPYPTPTPPAASPEPYPTPAHQPPSTPYPTPAPGTPPDPYPTPTPQAPPDPYPTPAPRATPPESSVAFPSAPPGPVRAVSAHGPAVPPGGPGGGHPADDPRARELHRELCEHRRGDVVQRGLLAARLRELPDELLLRELRSGELPPDSVELLLDELGDARRVRERGPAMRHELCAEVLRNGLYLAPHGQGSAPVSRTAAAGRAADLFTWAVAPLARDGRYLHDLLELLHRMSRDRHPSAGTWLQRAIIAPANGQVPDLPPALWQQILRDVISRTDGPPAAPAPPSASHPPASAPRSFAGPPEPAARAARFAGLTHQPGCVIGAFLGVIAVLVALTLVAL
ncbi:hypothetical protein [Streptomyces glaucus]|uniref:Uncharacterized protein n=1 Tax=Streptomyces glaucus TaxID=284029 RepID=A0ABN3KDC1_9ACTN